MAGLPDLTAHYVPHSCYRLPQALSTDEHFPPNGEDEKPPLYTTTRAYGQHTSQLAIPQAAAGSRRWYLPPPLLAHSPGPITPLTPLSSGQTATRHHSNGSPSLLTSPMQPIRERTSLQRYANPLGSNFSQASLVIERPLLAHIRLLIVKWIVEWWLVEIFSWLFSTMCLATVIGALLLYDKQEIPNWPLGFTINGFLSIFSAAAKSALILPTAECLGQLKWNWFKRDPRCMIDFEILDTASRGPWGSILLITRAFRNKGLSLASLGAAIILLCLPLDLFFQQVIQLRKVWIPVSYLATIPRAVSYAPHNTQYYVNETGPFFAPDLTMEQVIQPFFYSEGIIPDLDMFCPTSNCTWPPFDTLGVCSSCNPKVFDELEFGCTFGSASWLTSISDYFADPTSFPNITQCGWFLNRTSNFPVLMSGYAVDPETGNVGEALQTRIFPLVDANSREQYYSGSILHKDIVNSLLDVVITKTPGGADGAYHNATPEAYECVLSWCTQTLSSSQYWGTVSQNITSSFFNQTKTSFPWFVDMSTGYTEYNEDFYLTPPGQDLTFGLSNDTELQMAFMMDTVAPLYVTTLNETSEPQTKYYTLNGAGAKVRPSVANAWLAENITQQFESVAQALTNVVRNTLNESGLLDNVYGTAWDEKVHVEVRWTWLVLPLILSAMSLFFLVSTVVRSSKEVNEVGIWKNSVLAILFNGLGDDVQRSVGPNARMGEVLKKARELQVKLASD